MPLDKPADKLERAEGVKALAATLSEFLAVLFLSHHSHGFQEVASWCSMGIDVENVLLLRQMSVSK